MAFGCNGRVAILACVFLSVAGCSGGHDQKAAKPSGVAMVPTNVVVPDPCRTVDGALVDELVGTDRGIVQNTIDPSQAVASARCVWDGGDYKDESRKQGRVEANLTVELKHVAGAQQYSAATAAYKGVIAGKTCKSITIPNSDACWYARAEPSFSVVVRKGYVVVWVTSTSVGSPGVQGKRLPTTASRIAESVAGNIA